MSLPSRPKAHSLWGYNGVCERCIKAAVVASCFLCCSAASVFGELHFAHLSEPHLFDGTAVAAANSASFREAAVSIGQRVSGGLQYEFVVVTGDLGLNALPFNKSGTNIFATNTLSEAAEDVFKLMQISKVRSWYFLPGESDLRWPPSDSLSGYAQFIRTLSVRAARDGFGAYDLSGAETNRLASSVDLTRDNTQWTLVGLNNAFFSSDYAAEPAVGSLATDVLNQLEGIQQRVGNRNPVLFTHFPGTGPGLTAALPRDRAFESKWTNVISELSRSGRFSGHMPKASATDYGPYQSGLGSFFTAPPLGLSAGLTGGRANRGYAEVWAQTNGEPARAELIWLGVQPVAMMEHTQIGELLSVMGVVLLCGCIVCLYWKYAYPELRRALGNPRDVGLNNAALMGSVTITLFVIGLAALSCIGFCTTGTGAPAFCVGSLWALAASAAGGAIGFLFGIPRRTPPTASAASATSAQASGVTTATASTKPLPKPAMATDAPTSLDEISDWLTKLIVGGTIFQSGKLLPLLEQGGSRFAAAMGTTHSELWTAVGSALLVYFGLVGVCGGYFSGRLYLNRALRDADSGERVINEEAEIEEHVVTSVDEAPLAIERDGGAVQPDPVGSTAAKKIADVDLDRLSNWRDIRVWAKANLLLGNFQEAITGYRRAVSIVPRDPETRLGYAVALSGKNLESPIILAQLEEAHRTMSQATRPDLRKSIYKALTYCALYLDSPRGFLKALAYAHEFFVWRQALAKEQSPSPQDAPESAGIWLNVACAYGQAARWYKVTDRTDPITDLPVDQLLAWPGQQPPPAAAADRLDWLRDQSLAAVEATLRRNPQFLTKVKELIHGETKDNDLAVFKGDTKFDTLIKRIEALGSPTPAAPPVNPPGTGPTSVAEASGSGSDSATGARGPNQS